MVVITRTRRTVSQFPFLLRNDFELTAVGIAVQRGTHDDSSFYCSDPEYDEKVERFTLRDDLPVPLMLWRWCVSSNRTLIRQLTIAWQ